MGNPVFIVDRCNWEQRRAGSDHHQCGHCCVCHIRLRVRHRPFFWQRIPNDDFLQNRDLHRMEWGHGSRTAGLSDSEIYLWPFCQFRLNLTTLLQLLKMLQVLFSVFTIVHTMHLTIGGFLVTWINGPPSVKQGITEAVFCFNGCFTSAFIVTSRLHHLRLFTDVWELCLSKLAQCLL